MLTHTVLISQKWTKLHSETRRDTTIAACSCYRIVLTDSSGWLSIFHVFFSLKKTPVVIVFISPAGEVPAASRLSHLWKMSDPLFDSYSDARHSLKSV